MYYKNGSHAQRNYAKDERGLYTTEPQRLIRCGDPCDQSRDPCISRTNPMEQGSSPFDPCSFQMQQSDATLRSCVLTKYDVSLM